MFHSTHYVEFFHKSLFSLPIFTTVNCVTFDAISRVTGADANLCFATKCCFTCRIANHHADVCPQRSLGMLLCRRLEDFHSELIVGLDGYLFIGL